MERHGEVTVRGRLYVWEATTGIPFPGSTSFGVYIEWGCRDVLFALYLGRRAWRCSGARIAP